MNETIELDYLSEIGQTFRNYKLLADKSLAQISDSEFFRALDAESNSIAHIVKHLAGNFRSRWTDFLTTDGEKPNRNRDQEFEINDRDTAASLKSEWENGWHVLLATIDDLQPADLARTVSIRDQPHTVLQALNRALAHCAYHTGQIAFLAKHWRGAEWQSLSIPRHKSNAFNDFARENSEQNRFETVTNFNERESRKKF